MTVKAILFRKGSDIVTIKSTATLCDAVTILDMHRIGAVVITDADQSFSAYCQNEISYAHLLTTPELQAVVTFATSRSKR
jgi:CBS domain-containing protein